VVRTGHFFAPTWDGDVPIIPCAGWDVDQAWRNFDAFVIKDKEVLLAKGLLERFNRLKPFFPARKKFYKRIGVSIIPGFYDFT
jgi:hypothetical protein